MKARRQKIPKILTMSKLVYDVECYPNYFLILTLDLDTGEVLEWCTHNGKRKGLNPQEFLERAMKSTMIGFNSFGYDKAMVCAYLSGYNHEQLYALSQYLVTGDQLTPWRVWQEHPNITFHGWRDIDIMPICPGVASLKMYAGRIGFKKLQDLPIHWENDISEEDHKTMRPYCQNDIEATGELYDTVREGVKLRVALGRKYKIDLLSCSGPKIAEEVLKHELQAVGCKIVKYPEIELQEYYEYVAPEWLEFDEEVFQERLDTATLTSYKLSNDKKFKIPAELKTILKYKDRKYKMGIGGLHSQEKNRSVVVKPGYRMCEVDVGSFYPWMIINEKYAPEQYGEKFTEVYTKIVKDRMRAKAAGDDITAESLKLVINSSFGKFGNKYSAIFSPSLLIHTTLTGQFLLLKLIEMFERNGIDIVSANTDGVVCYYPDELRTEFDEVVRDWQELTNLKLDETEYSGLYNESVNSYLAVKPDGTYKGKATFAAPGLQKNPQAPIVAHAVAEHIAGRDHFIHTIKSCTDLSQFCYLRLVTGGCEYDLENVGKTIRWYIGTEFRLPFMYIKSGNNVPNSMNGVMCQLMPDEFPDDLNYAYYIQEAKDLFANLGLKLNG